MDQNNSRIPNFGHADDGFKVQVKVTGAIVHGRTPARRVYLSDRFPGNTNLVLETFLRVLQEECGGDAEKLPPIIFVQLDNTSTTNKNNIFAALSAALVELGVSREIWINLIYLPVGHTHEDIDQMFSSISQSFDYTPPRSLSEMYEVIARIQPQHNRAKAGLGGIQPYILGEVPDYKVPFFALACLLFLLSG
jgi:hypothetical protein